jgi:Gas vesicle protein K
VAAPAQSYVSPRLADDFRHPLGVGGAFMKLEETLHDIAARFGISPDELNLDLGPVGKLL